MEYIYSALVLHAAGKQVSEDAVAAILKSAGVEPDAARIKALTASLEGVNIDEAIASAMVAAAPAAANPLYLKILLDELRVTGTYERMDERLDNYLATTDISALLKKVLARYQHDYECDRKDLVSETLGLIWAARRGLTETELLCLLKPAHLPQLPPAIWNPLRAALEEGLVDRGGILNFTHDFLQTAVEAAFVPDEDKRDELRLRLANFFETEPVTAQSCDELSWLLWQTKQRDRLRACLLNIDRFLICSCDQEELQQYWVWLKEERTMGKSYLDAFELWFREPGRAEIRLLNASKELAVFLDVAALYNESELLKRRASALAENIYGLEHSEVAVNLNNLAVLLQATNRLGEAESLLRRALAIDEKNLGSEHNNVAIRLNNLARLLQDTNRLVEAELLFRRALAISEKSLGKENPVIAIRLNNLAVLLKETDRLEEAETHYRRALAIWEKSLGAEHPNVAAVLGNLANLLGDTNRLVEAESFLRRALTIAEQIFGPEHPKVATAVNNLGVLLQQINRLEEAEPLFRRALAINEKILSPENPEIAINLINLALFLQTVNRRAEAEPLLRRALEITFRFKATTGYEHPNQNKRVKNYRGLLGQMGHSEPETLAQLNAIGTPFGIQFGSNA